MKINISEIKSIKNYKKSISMEINKDSFSYEGETIKYLKPISFEGSIINNKEDIILLKGKVETEILLTCSRCLEQYPYKINLDIEERFSANNDLEDDGEVILITDDTIDVYELIENNLIISLPIKRLCNINCKGLCQSCGKNLNYGQCSCDNREIDPRLEKLKDLFSNS